MKSSLKAISVLCSGILCFLGFHPKTAIINDYNTYTDISNENISVTEKKEVESSNLIEEVQASEIEEVIVYDGMTMEELASKLDRSLNSTLAGKGNVFASYAIEMGVDPYLAVAISLHETGCKWTCSTLVTKCNNIGGQKGSGCGNGGYARFKTLDEGIYYFMKNLHDNYYAYGLTTPETMNKKYASSTSWASKVNRYIDEIKAK